MKILEFIPPDLKHLTELSCDALVFYRFAEMRPLRGVASLVDWRLYGHLSHLVIEGFLTGQEGESLVMPLKQHLGPDYILILGLGERTQFNRDGFGAAIRRTLEILRKLHSRKLALALPGRTEQLVDAESAVEWFLGELTEKGENLAIHLVESHDEQKFMAPEIERWRLKQLVD